MKMDQENICHCSGDEPAVLRGSAAVSPLYCMQCKIPVSLEGENVAGELADAINEWAQVYSALFTLWRDSVEYREWAKQQLLDEIGSINLEGLELAQQYNAIRKTYYWMFQDNGDKDYVQPQHCPFCGASMLPTLENDFKVCHPCRVAYPDRQTA